jgi:hypothetical protein
VLDVAVVEISLQGACVASKTPLAAWLVWALATAYWPQSGKVAQISGLMVGVAGFALVMVRH